MTIAAIATLTLHEMLRRRLILVAAILTAFVAILTGFGFHALATQMYHGAPLSRVHVIGITSQLLTLVAYMFSLVFALGGAFAAAPTLASDVETGLLLPMLTRPIRRVEIVLGKFLGLSLFLSAYAFACGLIEFGVVRIATGYWPPHPFVALGYLCGVAIVMVSVTLLFSSRLSMIASGIAAVVLFGLAWIVGIAADIGANAHNQAMVDAGTVSQLILPSDAFWRAAVYHLEPAALVASLHGSAPFVVAAPPPPAMIAWAIGWIAVVVGCACWSFATRDF
ncbi:MAG: ABC transporter permease [Candidatus Eremiobacteraeota bacterium]|nr:ABC transporter permease [Candidatus Eremiobacteraeota bacterium]